MTQRNQIILTNRDITTNSLRDTNMLLVPRKLYICDA